MTIKIPPGASSATVTNLMEKPEGQSLKVVNDQLTLAIRPYEILSVRVNYTR